MINTGIYLRVSTEEQAREGFSIRAQEEKLRAYAAAKDWHIYNIYSDEGISGKDIDGRPAVKQLLTDISNGKVNNVLVYKIDRLTRSMKNLIELVELFNHFRCTFNSLIESIDTTTATGRMFLKIIGIFAEFERENLAERVRLGLERKVKEGYTICGHTSYGYKLESGNRIQTVVENEAVIVRRIFNMYLYDDYSLTQIAKTLNAEKIPTKYNKKWVTMKIKELITNPNYIGKVRYAINDQNRYFEVDGQHKAIVDESIFYQVQEKLKLIKKVSKTKRPSSGAYFCGVLYCPTCGSKYSTKWNYRKKDGQRIIDAYPGYRCIKSVNGAVCSSRSTVSHTKLERAFEAYISKINDFSETDGADLTNSFVKTDNIMEITTIVSEIKQIEKKNEEVMSLFMSNNIDFTTYQDMVKMGRQRRLKLDERLYLLNNSGKTTMIRHTAVDIAVNFRDNWLALGNEQRLQFVQKFIKKIVLHNEPQPIGRFKNVIIDELVFNEF